MAPAQNSGHRESPSQSCCSTNPACLTSHSLAGSGQGQDGERQPSVPTELRGHSGWRVPSRRHLQWTSASLPVSLVIPNSRGRTPSVERWCGLLRSLHTAGAFSGQALFGGEQASQQECSEGRARARLPALSCSHPISPVPASLCCPEPHLERLGLAGTAQEGQEFPQGGEESHTAGEVAMLQVIDAPGATVHHPGALGWWDPRVG